MRLQDFINIKYLKIDILNYYCNLIELKKNVKCIYIDNFLNKDTFNFLEKSIIDNKNKFIGEHVETGKYGSAIKFFLNDSHSGRSLKDFFSSNNFKLYIEKITSIKNLHLGCPYDKYSFDAINDGIIINNINPDFNGGISRHEDYEANNDIDLQTVGNIVLYINPFYKKEYGGYLELGSKKNGKIETYDIIEPYSNRLIVLIGEQNKSWHKVSSINNFYDRNSISIQLKRKKIKK